MKSEHLNLVVTEAKRGGSVKERSLTRGALTTMHISGGRSQAGCLWRNIPWWALLPSVSLEEKRETPESLSVLGSP